MPSYRKRHHEPENVSPPPDASPPVSETASAASKETMTPAVDPSTPAPEAPAPSEPPPAPQPAPEDDTRTRLAAMEAAQEQARHVEQQRLIAAAMALQQPQQQEPTAQPQQPVELPSDTVEVLLARSGLPDRAQQWLRSNPQYLTNPRLNARLQHFHYEAVEQAPQFSDEYFTLMERMLGFAPPAPPGPPAEIERPVTESEAVMTTPPPAPPPRRPITAQRATEPPASPPAPPPQYRGPQVSAPPSREAVSMSTGRPPGRITLTTEEQQIAWESRRIQT